MSADLNETDGALAVYSKISRHRKEDLRFPRDDLSPEVKHLITELLNPLADTRLGCQGIVDVHKGGSVIRAHPWFASIDWVTLASKTTTCIQADALAKMLQDKLHQPSDSPPELEVYTGDRDWFEDF